MAMTRDEINEARFAASTHIRKGTELTDASVKLLARLVHERFDFASHLERQRAFSLKTFGPGGRTAGLIDHVKKELLEIEQANAEGRAFARGELEEWVDVAILAFDAMWRLGFDVEEIIEALVAKQTKNEARKWPDWRTAEPGKAIEHIRRAEVKP